MLNVALRVRISFELHLLCISMMTIWCQSHAWYAMRNLFISCEKRFVGLREFCCSLMAEENFKAIKFYDCKIGWWCLIWNSTFVNILVFECFKFFPWRKKWTLDYCLLFNKINDHNCQIILFNVLRKFWFCKQIKKILWENHLRH